MTDEQWSVTDAQRQETVGRITTSIINLSFSQGHSLSETVAAEAAASAEKKAYTVAKFESRTTTGYRPHNETLKAYARYTISNLTGLPRLLRLLVGSCAVCSYS